MSSIGVVAQDAAASTSARQTVNDFNLQIATVNGSGSQTANLVLFRSIFRMGIPVSGKNLFPSNIAGLPTWYTIRVSRDGYLARKREVDVLVAMNAATAREDVMGLDSGAAVVYDEAVDLSAVRDDLVFYPVPCASLVAEACPNAKLRRLVRNMIYVGVLAKLLNIDLVHVEESLNRYLGRKVKALKLNQAALRGGYEYADEHLGKRDQFVLEPMSQTNGKILVDGGGGFFLLHIYLLKKIIKYHHYSLQ